MGFFFVLFFFVFFCYFVKFVSTRAADQKTHKRFNQQEILVFLQEVAENV